MANDIVLEKDPPITQQLAELIRAKPVTRVDLEQAALFTLDTLANALAGRRSVPGEKLLEWARREPLDTGREAFLIGALTHILEVDDLHRASVVHPGCVVVPAAYVVARREGATGEAMLVAVLQGYEAACRVGTAVGPAHYRIWHNTASCGPYGSAAAAAHLVGLDERQTLDAFGNAGAQSFGLWEFMESAAMTKHLHAGRAAEAGVLAADLAALGFTGPPKILEGTRGFFAAMCPDAEPTKVLHDPEAPWQLRQTSIKPWNCCRHTHPAIDAALSLHQRLGDRQIESVDVGTYQAALNVCDRPEPTTEYGAKFSLQHTVAIALLDGRVDFESFGPEARRRSAPLGSRVSLRASDEVEQAYPDRWGTELSLTLTDGEVLRIQVHDAKGDPELPLTTEELIAKAETLLQYSGAERPREVIDSILAMATGGPIPDLPFGPAAK